MNIVEEYREADLTNIETLKQIVINKFKENNLSITKIRSGKTDGIFVYHVDGMLSSYSKREKVSETEYSITYRRYKQSCKSSFIATDDIESFQSQLEMVILEAKNRKKN